MLALVALALTAFDYWWSYNAPDGLDDVTFDLLALNGFNAYFIPVEWMFHAYYGIQGLALCGLAVPVAGARQFFLINVTFFAALTLLTGISIALPIQAFVATLLAYIYGALILLLFKRQDS